jgi:hypothetical protein
MRSRISKMMSNRKLVLTAGCTPPSAQFCVRRARRSIGVCPIRPRSQLACTHMPEPASQLPRQKLHEASPDCSSQRVECSIGHSSKACLTAIQCDNVLWMQPPAKTQLHEVNKSLRVDRSLERRTTEAFCPRRLYDAMLAMCKALGRANRLSAHCPAVLHTSF